MTRYGITYKQQLQNLIQKRDDAYEAYAQKTEDIFWKQWIRTEAKWAEAFPTRSDFHLSDIVMGMSLTNALELGKSQNWSPTKLAAQLAVLCMLAEEEIA